METMIKKYQQKFKKAREEMSKWDDIQSRLISQFRNASSIIARLEIIQNTKNYASLNSIGGIEVAVMQKQMDSLQTILLSMRKTMEDFRAVVLSLEKLQYDGKQLVKGSSNQMNKKQLQHRIGVKPTLANCIDGLVLLHEMHLAEYLLKSSLVSALSTLALKPNSGDLGALHQLLVDQPNILSEEVKCVFDIVFAEEIC
ncbi:OPENER [Hibiscus trionum]|uniref:OPENER n=2 Tax=Hibiscus trionum TaxID=183268 RepID=A0A9W7MEG3_HIBTR|nr:OPENER [Hibiscus trionum]